MTIFSIAILIAITLFNAALFSFVVFYTRTYQGAQAPLTASA